MTRKIRDSHVYTGDHLRHLKKNKQITRDQPLLCTIANETSDIHSSTVIPTSSSLEMI